MVLRINLSSGVHVPTKLWPVGAPPGALGIGLGSKLGVTLPDGRIHRVTVERGEGCMVVHIGNSSYAVDRNFPSGFLSVCVLSQGVPMVDLPEPDHRYPVNATRYETRNLTELELLQQSPAYALGKKIAAYCNNGPHHVSLHPRDSAVQVEIFGLDKDDLSEEYKDWFENDYFQYAPDISEFKWIGSSQDLCAFTFGLLQGLGQWKTEWLEAMRTVNSMRVQPLIIQNGSKADADLWFQFARP